MYLRIETLAEKKLVGKKMNMSFTENKTTELWRSFMPRRKEITNNIGSEMYSLEVYDPQFFAPFDPARQFEKWACIEVSDFENVPAGMETLIVPPGLYAVFLHRGPASEAARTYEYIFRTWLPSADFALDNRPHFAVMGAKYRYQDAASEEEIWIPVQAKANTQDKPQ
jgi:AraC family transcriptional regulator